MLFSTNLREMDTMEGQLCQRPHMRRLRRLHSSARKAAQQHWSNVIKARNSEQLAAAVRQLAATAAAAAPPPPNAVG